MSIVWDIWNAIHGIVTSADMITLGIGVVILLAAGFVMQGFDSLISTTIIAMVAFGLAGFVRAVALGGHKATEFATTDWHNYATLTGLTLLAYALTFAVGIAVVHLVRSMVLR
jgi:ABC-type dipeptide/oligopeptide/nickel transport system permease subunit